jgi:hypothetical protein
VPNENTSLQLDTYRCRSEVWWQEQFTYVKATRQITTQPRYGAKVCVDIMSGTAVNVGVSPCDASKKSQQWSFVGTKIQNAANGLFLQVQPVSGYYLTYFAGASLNVFLGPKQPGYLSDFTLMDSSVLRNYKPPTPSAINHVQNGLFGMTWNEKLGLEADDRDLQLENHGRHRPQPAVRRRRVRVECAAECRTTALEPARAARGDQSAGADVSEPRAYVAVPRLRVRKLRRPREERHGEHRPVVHKLHDGVHPGREGLAATEHGLQRERRVHKPHFHQRLRLRPSLRP